MRPLRVLILLLWGVFLVGLTGCASVKGAKTSLRPSKNQALISFYLTGTGPSSTPVSFELKNIAILQGDVWLDLGVDAARVQREEIQGRQKMLGIALAPTGEFRQLRFFISALKVGAGGPPHKEDIEIRMTLPTPVRLEGGDSTCLFVDWILADPIPGEAFEPRFSARGQDRPLGRDVVYVSCPDISTIYLVRMGRNFVEGAIGVPGPLGDVVADARKGRFYVLSTAERSVYVFDAVGARYIERIPLPVAVSPRHMALADDGTAVFVTDARSGRVVKVLLSTGGVTSRILAGLRPEKIIYFSEGSGRLALSSPVSNQVYILNSETLETLRVIPAGNQVDSLLYAGGLLHVAEKGADTVSVYDPRTGRQQSRISVGFVPSDMVEGDSGAVYVSNSGEESLSLIAAGQNLALRKVDVGSPPERLLYSRRRQDLFVTTPREQTLRVLDLVGERVRAIIPLGGAAFSMAASD